MKNINPKYFHLILFSLLGFLFFSSCHSYAPTSSTLRLHDIWGLKELEGQVIDPMQGAVLELYVEEQRFLMSIRERSYQGRFRVSDSRIDFLKINSKHDGPPSIFEETLTIALAKANQWKFEKRFLHLFDGEDLVAKFVKMD